jgi:hypothetical protein
MSASHGTVVNLTLDVVRAWQTSLAELPPGKGLSLLIFLTIVFVRVL